MVMSLALYLRNRRFDPGLLQSVGWDYKPRSRLQMTLVVGGTLNPNQPTNTLCVNSLFVCKRDRLDNFLTNDVNISNKFNFSNVNGAMNHSGSLIHFASVPLWCIAP